MAAVEKEPTFEALLEQIEIQQRLIHQISENLKQLQIGAGGGGTASIEDYESGKQYKRNMLIVDPSTETVYRVIPQSYVSTTCEDDIYNGYLKLVGFENAITTFPHDPTQAEIDALPDGTLVGVYSSNDAPYVPDT